METEKDCSCHKLSPQNRGLRWLEGIVLNPSLGHTLPPIYISKISLQKLLGGGRYFLILKLFPLVAVGCYAARRHRSLQYLTVSHVRCHFLRQENGLRHTGQTLVGRWLLKPLSFGGRFSDMALQVLAGMLDTSVYGYYSRWLQPFRICFLHHDGV